LKFQAIAEKTEKNLRGILTTNVVSQCAQCFPCRYLRAATPETERLGCRWHSGIPNCFTIMIINNRFCYEKNARSVVHS